MKSLLSVDRELGRLLTKAAVEKHSGVITGVRGKLKRLFCLIDGGLAYAVSNVLEEQLAEHLTRCGLMTPEDLAAARKACAAQQDLKLARFLIETGAVSEEQIEQAVRGHLRRLLFETLDWSDGECRFERGQPNLDGEYTIRANSVELLLEYAAARPASLDAARMRAGAPNVQLVTSLHSERLLDGLSPDETAMHILGKSDGSRTLSQLVDSADVDPEAAWRSIYALVLAGILVPRGARQEAVSDSATVSRDELVARLDRAQGATHYAVLELNPTAKPDEIRDAYYFLARRYHPDRFRTSTMRDLIDRVEAYFAQVTEAYNALSDPATRAEYDAQMTAAKAPRKPEQDTRDLANQNYTRALALIKLRRFTDAVTSLENAIQLDPNQARFYLELGRLQARNPRHRGEAEKNLTQANKIDPALADGYYALGDLYARTGRVEQAARLFRETLRWEPGHVQATEGLEELGEAASTDGGKRRGLFRG